jgi:glycerol uptake facilitator-like aquaporin
MSNGLMNPTLALEVLFWSLGAYNQKDSPNAHPNESRFSYSHFGRYSWAYIIAPFLAACLAGYLAKKHMKIEKEMEDNDV